MTTTADRPAVEPARPTRRTRKDRGRHAVLDRSDLDAAPRWFFATDDRRHAVESNLSPGRGDVVRVLCGDTVTARGAARISTRSSSPVCEGCDGVARDLLGVPGYGEPAHHESPTVSAQ